MKFDLVTLGETMLRLSPPGSRRLEQANQFDLTVGGAESNVAANLARLGKRTAWISRLPDSPLGRIVTNTLQQHGVDTSGVIWGQTGRMGLYFIEYGESPRSTRIFYDRANSAASHMTPDELPEDIIRNARWLHLTGITPALSASCAATARAAMALAKRHGLTVSFDVNYRALLWSAETAAATLEPLCQTADYVTVALRDACHLFGASEAVSAAAHELYARWGGTIIITEGDVGVTAFDGSSIVTCEAMQATIVDRIGAGDALISGVICRLLESAPLAEALRFGAAMAALKLTIPGDIAVVTRQEVQALLDGDTSALRR